MSTMNEKQDVNRGKNPRYFVWGGLVVVAAILLTGIYFYRDTGFFSEQDTRLEQIAEDPQNFIGQEVRAVGEVSEVIGSRALVAQSTELESDDILVISRQPLMPVGGVGEENLLYQGGDRVAITGTVREFNIRELEQELGLDLVDEQFAQWEGRSVIIADSIETEL